MKTLQKIMYCAALSVGLAVAGCGGRSDDVPAAATVSSVPDSASASVDGFINFLLSLSTTDETSEPLTISDTFAVPPVESTEPQLLS